MYVCDNVVVLMSPCCFLFSYWKWWFVVNNHKITLLKNEGTRKKNQNIPHCSQNHQNTWNIETWWPVKGKKKKFGILLHPNTQTTHTHTMCIVYVCLCVLSSASNDRMAHIFATTTTTTISTTTTAMIMFDGQSQCMFVC